jgi:hypothetical protein
MTPKQKAKELAMKFDKLGETDNAKQCALIAVDEVLELIKILEFVNNSYYLEVKQEIQAL